MLCTSARSTSDAQSLKPWTDGATPELRAKTLAGEDVRLARFGGRTVIVNFWATWCAPCVAEMPSLQRLRDKLAAQGVEVIAVNFQENAARIQPFVDRLRAQLSGRARPRRYLAHGVGRQRVPDYLRDRPDRRIALVAIGEIDWDDPQVESRIRGLR